MSVEEIESAISQLPSDELSRFSQWFESFMAESWDRQIQTDADQGKFDKLSNKINSDFDQGLCKPL